MKKLILLSLCVFLCACQTISDLANNNPFLVSVVVRQSVAAYIDLAETKTEKAEKANEVKNVLEKINEKISENSETTISGLISYTNSLIDFEKLSASEQLIIQDVILIISIKLSEKSNEITPDTLVTIKSILLSALQATNN